MTFTIEDASTIVSVFRGDLRAARGAKDARRCRLAIGRALVMARDVVPRGQWGAFLGSNRIKPTTASDWMALARYVDKQPWPHDRPGFVYVIAGVDGALKVGFAVDIAKRIASLQTASPVDLRLLSVMRGTRATERRLHRQLAGFRLRGEWFRDCDETRAILIKAGA